MAVLAVLTVLPVPTVLAFRAITDGFSLLLTIGFTLSRKTFHGPRIVLAAFVVDFVAVGFWFYSFGVFLKPMAADLDLSRLQAGLGLPIAGVISAFLAPSLGRALDHRSIRKIMLAGACLVSASFLALGQVEHAWQYYLVVASTFALGLSMMGGVASSKLVANWYDRRRGTALGVATMGISLSGLLMPPLATLLIEARGWRGAYEVYGLLCFLVVVPLIAVLVVNRPEDLGQQPDGDAPPSAEEEAVFHEERYLPTREILSASNFWILAVGFGMLHLGLSAVLTHLVPYAGDVGIPPVRAASILSAGAAFGVVGKLLWGWVADRRSARDAVLGCAVMMILGLIGLMSAREYPSFLGAAACFGLGMGGVIPLQAAVTGSVFGRAAFGRASGLIRPVQFPIHMAGVPVTGYVFDVTGSYDVAFRILLLILFLSVVVLFGLRESRVQAA